MAHKYIEKIWNWKKICKQIVEHVKCMELDVDIATNLLFGK